MEKSIIQNSHCPILAVLISAVVSEIDVRFSEKKTNPTSKINIAIFCG